MSESRDVNLTSARDPSRGGGAALYALLAIALALVAWTFAPIPPGFARTLITDLAFTATSALAGILCLRAAARRALPGRPGRWLGLGCLAWCGGQLVWDAYDLVLRAPVPFLSLAEAGYVLFYVCGFLGLARLIQAHAPQVTAEAILDGLIVSAVAILFGYALVVEPVEPPLAVSQAPLLASLLWRVGAVGLPAVAAVALAVVWSGSRTDRAALTFLLGGLFAIAVADIAYARLALTGDYQVGTPLDLGWLLGFLLIGAAALTAQRRRIRPAAPVAPPRLWWRPAATIASVVALGGLAAASALSTTSRPAVAAGLVAVALVLAARLGYAARQDGRLARRTRERDRLAAEVAARRETQAATEAALAAEQAANAELRRLSQAQRDFTAVVSHEFRTPLTSIQGFAELLQRAALPPGEAHEFAGIIGDSAARLARLIDQMLDFERLEAGAVALRREPVDLNAVVVETVAALRPTNERHPIRLALDPTLSPLCADRDRLAQVVTNLLDNAIKYSPAGGEIVVATERAGGQAQLTVRDPGVGIPPEALATIFERYQRVATGPARHVHGTGLGLPIVRRLVAQHGGRVWAESAPGAGATFHVTLPLTGEQAAT